MVIALVETAKGIENVDAIAAVDGVDVVWLGHYDLTNFLGIPGEFDNPQFHAAVDRLIGACSKHGKTPGFLAGNEKWAREFRSKGLSHGNTWARHPSVRRQNASMSALKQLGIAIAASDPGALAAVAGLQRIDHQVAIDELAVRDTA